MPMMPSVGLRARQTHQERIPWGLTRRIYELSFVRSAYRLAETSRARLSVVAVEKITTIHPDAFSPGSVVMRTLSPAKTFPTIPREPRALRRAHIIQGGSLS